MKSLRLLVWLVAFATPPSFALESDAAGMFAFVHRDGHVTDKVFRLSLDAAGTWKLEDRKADGRWADVSCAQDCRLRDSTPADVARFLAAIDPAPADPVCIHNAGFAFCSSADAPRPAERAHVFFALTGPRPVPIRLVRLKAGSGSIAAMPPS